MELSRAEDVTREIQELMRLGKRGAEAKQLADEFRVLRAGVKERMDQCLAMLGAGDETGAIDLALLDPPLLQLVSALKFDDEPAWQQICAEAGYALAPVTDEAGFTAISKALEKEIKIPPSHSLWVRFHEAMSDRDAERAYGVLQVILRLDPENQDAKKSMPPLEENLLRKFSDPLSKTVRANDIMGTTMLLEKIERMGFTNTASIESWDAAKKIQSVSLIQNIQESYQHKNWRECVRLLGELDVIQDKYPTAKPDAMVTTSLNPIRNWSRESREEWEKAEICRESIGRLQGFLKSKPVNGNWGGGLSLAQLKEQESTLSRLVANVQSIGQPIPEAMKQPMEVALGEAVIILDILRRLIVRKGIFQKALIASCLMLLCLAVVCVFALVGGRSFMARIKKEDYIEGRHVIKMEKELQGVRLASLKAWIVPGFKKEWDRAREFVDDEMQKKDKMDAEIQSLEKGLEEDLNGGGFIELDGKLTNIMGRINSLAPVFLPEFSERINQCQVKLTDKLRKAGPAFERERDRILGELENAMRALGSGMGAEKLEANMVECRKHIERWSSTTNRTSGNYPRPSVNQVQRYQKLITGVDGIEDWDKRLADYRSLVKDTSASLRIKDMKMYLDALERRGASEVEDRARRRAALEMRALIAPPIDVGNRKISLADAVMRALYRPTWAGRYNNFLSKLKFPFINKPAGVDPTSFRIWRSELMGNLHVSKAEVFVIFGRKVIPDIVSDIPWPPNPTQPEIIYSYRSGLPPKVTNFRGYEGNWLRFFPPANMRLRDFGINIGGVVGINPVTGMPVNNAAKPKMSYITGHWENHPVSKMMSQKDILNICKVNSFVNEGVPGKWGVKGLEVLERLNRYGRENAVNVNELFMAYVTYKVYGILLETPDEWGLMWSPNANAQYQELQNTFDMDRVLSGEWMIYNKCREHAKYDNDKIKSHSDWFRNDRSLLQQHFAKSAEISFQEEAKAYHTLLQSTYGNGAKALFIGYKEPGNPVLPKPTPESSGYLVGYRQADKTFGAIAKVDQGGKLGKLSKPVDYSPVMFVDKSNLPEQKLGAWADFDKIMKGKYDPKKDLPKIFNLP